LVVSPHISYAYLSGEYEAKTTEQIDRLVQSGFVCYDLGASIGYMTLLMARKARHVYSFEPAPHAMRELEQNVAANRLVNVTTVAAPVSDSPRVVEFALTDNAYGSSIANPNSDKWPKIRLTCVRLDDFVESHELPDFIKVDVEAEEGRVLEGSRAILKRSKPIIYCELHTPECAEHVYRILTEYGYRWEMIDPEGMGAGGCHIAAFP
jgi:FkbM family methyltransferase